MLKVWHRNWVVYHKDLASFCAGRSHPLPQPQLEHDGGRTGQLGQGRRPVSPPAASPEGKTESWGNTEYDGRNGRQVVLCGADTGRDLISGHTCMEAGDPA